jgi:stage II sporulation protein AA (anti-sigma F factor antagonist)
MDDMVRVQFSVDDGTAVVAIGGEIDLSNVDAVRRLIDANLDAANRLVVDLCDLAYIDSAGIALLFALSERLETRGQELHVVVPEPSPVRRVLMFTDLPTHVAMHGSAEEVHRKR